MKTYGIGIIGYGGFGFFLHNSWKKKEQLRVVAVSDREKSDALPAGVKWYDDWQDLLKDNEVEIIAIATPPSSHQEIACAAMESGKHVLIEKPVATSMEDGIKILSTVKNTGRVASVNFMMRFNPIVGALEDLSRKKIFGELRRADVENYAQDSALPREHWFWDRTISGGILIEHGVHFIDMVNYLTDQSYCQVTGMSHSRNDRQQDQVLASVLYDRGLIATHYHAFAYPGFFESTSIRLAYDLAVCDIQGWIPLKGEISALVNSDTKKKLYHLPGLTFIQSKRIKEVEDVSRPKGWGEMLSHPTSPGDIFSHGKEYHVDEMVTCSFEIGCSKADVYSDCVIATMEDLIKAIENRDHKMRITIEDALSSLDIACQATQNSDSR